MFLTFFFSVFLATYPRVEHWWPSYHAALLLFVQVGGNGTSRSMFKVVSKLLTIEISSIIWSLIKTFHEAMLQLASISCAVTTISSDGISSLRFDSRSLYCSCTLPIYAFTKYALTENKSEMRFSVLEIKNRHQNWFQLVWLRQKSKQVTGYILRNVFSYCLWKKRWKETILEKDKITCVFPVCAVSSAVVHPCGHVKVNLVSTFVKKLKIFP